MYSKEKNIKIRNTSKVSLIVADLQKQIQHWERFVKCVDDSGLSDGEEVLIYHEAFCGVMVLENGTIDGFGLEWNLTKDPDIVVYLKGKYKPVLLSEVYHLEEAKDLEKRMEKDHIKGMKVSDKRQK